MNKITFSVAAIAATAAINELYKEKNELKRKLLYKSIECDSLEKVNHNLLMENIRLMR